MLSGAESSPRPPRSADSGSGPVQDEPSKTSPAEPDHESCKAYRRAPASPVGIYGSECFCKGSSLPQTT